MLVWSTLTLALLAQPPMVQVDRLSGGKLAGTLMQLDAQAVTIQPAGKEPSQVPLNTLLELRFPAPATTAMPVTGAEVTLQDGSHCVVDQVGVQVNKVTLQSAQLGTVTVPRAQLRSVRVGAPEPKLLEAWQKLLDKVSNKDVLVIRKGDALDFLNGIVGDVDDQNLKFLLDGDEIPVKRERIYGWIYPPAKNPPASGTLLQLAGDQLLSVKGVQMVDDQLQATLTSGSEIRVPLAQVRSLDFSAGKLKYLSQMTPRDVQYTPFFSDIWEYQKDRGPDPAPIQLDGQTYDRGLSIHSRTLLKFRLNGEYRRFTAIAGIDDLSDQTGLLGDVVLKISGDGKPLFESAIKGPDAARALDLDITQVRELEILVDFGGDLDIADWLDLADAKVLK